MASQLPTEAMKGGGGVCLVKPEARDAGRREKRLRRVRVPGCLHA